MAGSSSNIENFNEARSFKFVGNCQNRDIEPAQLFGLYRTGIQLLYCRYGFGGIQEETSYLGIPCLTVRNNTERPVTITHGTNKLVKIADITSQVSDKVSERREVPKIPFWDGNSAERSIKVINEYLND